MASRERGIPKSVHSVGQAVFCGFLLAARRKAGLTQHELAARLGKPQSFVAKVEGGERRLDVVEFLAVMRVIGDDPARLVRALQRAIEKRS